MKPTAKNLILGLLLASEGEALSARDFVGACALFDIRENNARVALVRLTAEGLIEAEGRGSYRLAGPAHELADQVATWRTAEQRLRPWSGGYLAVHSGALGRSDRTALRRRGRALQMLGLREFERGFYLRPDNIEDVASVRERLYALGLEREASVFVAQDFDAKRCASIRTLWDGKALNAHYRKQRARLETWMAKAERLETDVAARESFLLGSSAIREVVFDPLLPEPFVDTTARAGYIETVRAFDRCGHTLWRRTRQLGLPTDSIASVARGLRAH